VTPAPRPVLHIIPDLNVGGAERFLVNLVEAQVKQGLKVGVVSLFDRCTSHLEEALDRMDVIRWFLGKHRGPDVRIPWRVDQVVAQSRPWIIHTHRYALQYAAPMLIRRLEIPCVHTVQNMASRETTRFGQVINGVLFRSRVHPVAIAQEVALSIERRYRRWPAAVIPNAIPVAEYRGAASRGIEWRRREGVDLEAFLVTCIGRLVEQKNQALLLKASARLVQQGRRNLVVVFVGQGPDEEALRNFALELGISDRVRFLGVRSDILDVLLAADLVALPSRWEGTPLIIQEAMAAGRPIIATRVGGVPELVKDGVTGLVVASGDVDAMVKGIDLLWMDPSLRRRMGGAAATMALERFDRTIAAAQYLALYRRVSKEG